MFFRDILYNFASFNIKKTMISLTVMSNLAVRIFFQKKI
jgi:hypothetical protein